MAVAFPEIGAKVTAKVIEMQRDCTIGMKVGDEFDLGVHKCGNFCGYSYHNLFNWITTLQFGGTFPLFPDPDVQVWECPNAKNKVKVELRRSKR